MSISPERRFATSPKHGMLKMALGNHKLTVKTSHPNPTLPSTNNKMSLIEYKKRRNAFQNEQKIESIEEQLNELNVESNRTREIVEDCSKKLDLLIQKLCTESIFDMDDI
jgi:hypothetical protein